MVSIPPSKDKSNILQDHSKKTNMLLVQQQTHRPMERNWKPKHEYRQPQPLNIWRRTRKHKMKERKPLQQTVLGKLGIYMWKNEIRPINLHKNWPQMDQRLSCQPWNTETAGRKRIVPYMIQAQERTLWRELHLPKK